MLPATARITKTKGMKQSKKKKEKDELAGSMLHAYRAILSRADGVCLVLRALHETGL